MYPPYSGVVRKEVRLTVSVSEKCRGTSFWGVWGHAQPENFRVFLHLQLILRDMAL